MNKPSHNSKGFGALGVLAIIVVLVAVGGAGAYVWHRDRKKTATTNTTSSNTTATSTSHSGSATTTKPDPYAGWKTYCDNATASCIKYPADWSAVAGAPGAFQNSADTAHISLSPGTNKDGGEEPAYIVSVNSIPATKSLDVVGYIVNNMPRYGVFDSSYVDASSIKAGETANIADINYAFDSKVGRASLFATPGESGQAAITTDAQAKSWFTTSEAQVDLLAAKSLYYQ